jgi:large subunit ribosomal protein L31
MKTHIHPPYYKDAKVNCACGNSFITGSTLKEIKVDICSACHPFFTGEMKLIDTQGRIEKFEAKRQRATKSPAKRKKQKLVYKEERPRTLKEMLKKKASEDQTEKSKPKTSKQKK